LSCLVFSLCLVLLLFLAPAYGRPDAVSQLERFVSCSVQIGPKGRILRLDEKRNTNNDQSKSCKNLLSLKVKHLPCLAFSLLLCVGILSCFLCYRVLSCLVLFVDFVL
jgi:hypothetical protein